MNPRDNILRVLNLVDSIDREEGLIVYSRYHQVLKSVALQYGVRFEWVVAAFVSLSPNNDYVGTLRSLVSCLQNENPTVSTYKHRADAALRFLVGEPFVTPKRGKKILNFYLNITDPTNSQAITIDGHMMNVWKGGTPRPMKESLVGRRYEEIADDFRSVARENNLLPSQLQGMLWFTWKRINRIKAVHQLDLYQIGDQWKTLHEVAAIKAYE